MENSFMEEYYIGRALILAALRGTKGLEEAQAEYRSEDSGEATVTVSKELQIRVNGYLLKLRPLPKALFLLFLRHPEGILFKGLPCYREEFGEYYRRLSPRESQEAVERTVERLMDPYSNSLDTQRYLLRKQVCSQLNADIAANCIIVGSKGNKKRVLIDRARVIWE